MAQDKTTDKFTDKFDNLLVRNFATPQECQALIQQTQNKDQANVTDATVGSDRRKDPKVRNNQTAFVKKRDNSPEHVLRQRVDQLLQTRKHADTSISEPLQVQIYKPGQHYSKHTDSWENDAVCNDKTKQRTWTCVLYLNDVQAGGTTTFPQIDTVLHRPDDPTRAPEQGTLACWYNILPNLEANKLTEHQGDDVVQGEKYLANFWYQTEAKPQACAAKVSANANAKEKLSVANLFDGAHSSAGRIAWKVIVGAIILAILLLWWKGARRDNKQTKRTQARHSHSHSSDKRT